MKYEIKGGAFPVVVCQLASGEQMITEKGSMVWMSPNIGMETKGGGVGKMFSKVISGESMFQNIYTANGDGMIAFGSSFPGKIMAVEVGHGTSLIVQKSAFLASEKRVELSVHFNKKVGAGLFGGEGFIMQKVSGNGVAFIEVDGDLQEYELVAGEQLIVDSGYLAVKDFLIPYLQDRVKYGFRLCRFLMLRMRFTHIFLQLLINNKHGCLKLQSVSDKNK